MKCLLLGVALLAAANCVQAAEERRCTDDFHGVRIKDDDAIIELGAEADVQLVRTGNATLEVIADDVIVNGDVHADRFLVDGVDITELCNCSSEEVAPSSDVNVVVEIMTGLTEDSETIGSTFIEFYIPGKMWTPIYTFSRGGVSAGLTQTRGFVLPGAPTKVRLSVDSEDAWGIATVIVTIGSDERVVALCTPIVGVNPSRAVDGYWVSTDPSSTRGNLPQEIIVDIVPVCSSYVTILAETATQPGAETLNTVYVEFLVNGSWTDPYTFFKGSTQGDYETNHYWLEAAPTDLAFTVSSTDMWGYDHLSATVDGEVHVLACDGTVVSAGSNGHWVDNNNAAVPDRVRLDIAHDECDLTNVTLALHVGDRTDSGTNDPVRVRFLIAESQNWTDYFNFFSSIGIGDDLEVQFRVDGTPIEVELSITGDNAFGIGHLTSTINHNDTVNIVCNDVIGYPPIMGDNGYWLDGDGTDGMPSELVISLSQSACTHIAVVSVTIGSKSNSQTTASVYAGFEVNDDFTGAIELFNGAAQKSTKSKAFGLQGMPTKLELTADGTDAVGYDHVFVDVNGVLYEIVCEGTQTDNVAGTRTWLDGDASIAPDTQLYDIGGLDCNPTTIAPIADTTAIVV
eukprot:INCI8169.1.p1 GENE.INCI8169.1~~INCI8169.1.p1  ORF type:complete len:626 (+),score=120.76 INCI8169.1:161-2038(+)